jgi:rod shape-determining protein MreD
MQTVSLKNIYLSLLLALILQLAPWQGFGLLIRPDFILLAVLYWLMRAPHLCNIGTAWLAGLIVDLISGGLFGQNALAYALTAFFAVSYQRRLALFNIWQQAAYVFVLLIFNQCVLMVLKLFAGEDVPQWTYFLPSVSGTLLWQLVIFSRIGTEPASSKN